WILFAFQFFWQFPHFWAIAWVGDKDYKKAGFKMLPTSTGKSRATARLILGYTLCLIPLVWFPLQNGLIGMWGAAFLALLALLFAIPAWKLLRHPENDKMARSIMFASFLYLPLSELVFLYL
ncbi:MAG: UbiA family prenyltransferase, partial [Bacteroidota bacterium]